VFRYFKDLILHKLKGAPMDLLRCIIPGEADILDKAAGVHVRFRLGGHIFPPKIYYKIFTHRPLCDLNAFAPRNYANESLNDPSSLHLNPQRRDQPVHKGLKDKYVVISTHMRVGGALYDATVDTSGGTKDWYRREDCNFWRPISHEATDDPMFETPYKSMSRSESTFNSKKMKKAHYHFSRFKRQEDIVRDRKKKKRDWMLKAYMFSANNRAQQIGEESGSAETPMSERRRQPSFSPRGDPDPSSESSLVQFMEEEEEQRRRQGPSTTTARQVLQISDSVSEGTTYDRAESGDGGGGGGGGGDEPVREAVAVASSPGYHVRVRTSDVMEDEDLLKWRCVRALLAMRCVSPFITLKNTTYMYIVHTPIVLFVLKLHYNMFWFLSRL
jgi:hypothetical protein